MSFKDILIFIFVLFVGILIGLLKEKMTASQDKAEVEIKEEGYKL